MLKWFYVMSFEEIEVNWSHVPLIQDLERYIQTRSKKQEIPILRGLEFQIPFHFKENQYLLHVTSDVNEIKLLYEQNGFSTKTVIQDPFGHIGPTVACPVGFPFNLPKNYPELKKFNRWICRVHVDIVKNKDKRLLSVPHIEPDPIFHPISHLWDTFIMKNIVRGEIAVELLKFLGVK